MKSITKITPKIKNLIYDQLDFIGVSPALRGYEYLATTLGLVLQHPELKDSITHLYQIVGELHESTGSRVERSIRHAIEVVFNRMPMNSPNWVCFKYMSSDKGKPTNKEFISTMVNMVRKEISEMNPELPGQIQMEGV